MSRGGSEKGSEVGRGNTEKRGESIVILNRKYSGIKLKRGHKKRLQLARIKDLISTVTASGAIFLLCGRKSLRGVTDCAPYHRTGFL